MNTLNSNLLLFFFLVILHIVQTLPTLFNSYFTASDLTQNEGTQFYLNELGWTISGQVSGIYSDCGSKKFVGGRQNFGNGSLVTNLIQLPPHYKIKVYFNVWRIDSWDGGEVFVVYLDDQRFTLPPTKEGDCSKDQFDSFSLEKFHYYSTIFIGFTTNLDQPPTDESWAIRDIYIYLELCPSGCKTCTSYTRDQYFQCMYDQLIYSGLLSDAINDGWFTQSGLVQTSLCGSNIPLLGGVSYTGIGSTIQKIFNLPPHSLLKIRIRLAMIDDWNNNNIYILIDDHQVFATSHTNLPLTNKDGDLKLCGQPQEDYLYSLEYTQVHQNQLLKITVTTNLDGTADQKSFGIRDIQIFSTGNGGQQCGNGLIELSEQCDDENMLPFDGCFNCQYSCIENCHSCINGLCFLCVFGFEFDILQNFCINLDLNQLTIPINIQNNFDICNTEQNYCSINCLKCTQDICLQCEGGFLLINNSCQPISNYQENLQINSDCLRNRIQFSEQFLVRKLGIEQSSDFQNCQDQCKLCLKGVCYQCNDGWEVFNYECKIKCGNQITVTYYQCKQSNNDIVQFGLNQCKSFYLKQLGIQGWYNDGNQNCQQKCLDNSVEKLSYFQQCSNDDHYFKEGCLECNSQCCQNCLICQSGLCLECQPSFILEDQQCNPICGDGLVAQGYEQCDDMNDEPYDGCYECQYQCKKNCQQCIEGVCYDECKDGYHLINDECVSVCGDGIISDVEDCDDQNDIKEDGCYQCKYYCPLNCDACERGKCLECENGYKLLQTKNFCQFICGDGLTVIQEDCDDLNKLSGDGCSSLCKIEDNYVCHNSQTSPSLCTFIEQPYLILKWLEEKDLKQYATLLFSQEVKVDDSVNYTDKLQFSLLSTDESSYSLNITAIQEPSEVLSNVQYNIEISFYGVFKDPPYLQVTLLYPLYSKDEAELLDYSGQVKLNTPKYFNEGQKNTAAAIAKFNQYTINSMGAVTVVVLFFGNTLFFGSVLEILQQQSYLRFINLNFPQNLCLYFESSDSISIQPILDYFSFLNAMKLVIDENYVESNQKFKQYSINSDLLTNISGQVFQVIILFLSYILCVITSKTIQFIKEDYFLFIGKMFTVFTFKLQRKCFRYSKQFNKDLLKILLRANCWDLLLTAFLQITSSQPTSFRQSINNLLAYTILFSCFILIISDINKQSLFKYKDPNEFWKQKFDLFTTMKKLAFISVLVIYQNCQELQILLLGIISNSYLIYIYKYYPQNSKFAFMNNVFQESIIFLFTLSSISFWDIFTQKINYEKQVSLGWLQMALLILVLLVNLSAQVKEMIIILTILFNTKIKSRCLKKQSSENFEENHNSNSTSNRGAVSNSRIQQTPQSISDLIVTPLFNSNQVAVTFAPGQGSPKLQNIEIKKIEE